MNKLTTLIASLILSFTAQAQIPNASFENWTTTGSYSTPDDWDNFNALTASAGVFTCEKGTIGAPHGSAYLKLTSKIAGTTAVPGLAASGKYDFTTKKPISGFPYTGRPQYLTGKWQYMANGTDTGRIAVLLTRWNSTTGKRENVAGFEYDLPGMVTSWASFSIPLTYLSGARPDTAIIGLTSSNKSITAGSYLYIDSLNFSGFAVGVPENNNPDLAVTLSPNPAKDNLSIDFGTALGSSAKLSIIDMYGRTIREATVEQGKQVYAMPLHDVATGLYLLRIKQGESM